MPAYAPTAKEREIVEKARVRRTRHIDGPPHSDSLAASGKRERTEFAPPWSMITSRRRQPNPWPPLLRISQDPNDRRDNTGACGSGSPYSIRWDRHAGPACRPLRSPLRRGFTNTLGIVHAPTDVDAHVAAVGPAQFLQPLQECREARVCRRIVGRGVQEHADPPHPLALRPRRKRPRDCRAAEQHDERAPFHSITSSARASSVGGTSMSSALAVCILTMNSNAVARITGRSAGIAPWRMRPV